MHSTGIVLLGCYCCTMHACTYQRFRDSLVRDALPYMHGSWRRLTHVRYTLSAALCLLLC